MESDSAPSAAEWGLSTIGQIAVAVSDVDRALSFYRDGLGMKLLFQFPNLAFFDCGGVRLMLSDSEKPSGDSPFCIYYRVSDIEKASAVLRARGVQLEREPHCIARMPDHELWMAFFRDPDRNLLAMMSEVSPG